MSKGSPETPIEELLTAEKGDRMLLYYTERTGESVEIVGTVCDIFDTGVGDEHSDLFERTIVFGGLDGYAEWVSVTVYYGASEAIAPSVVVGESDGEAFDVQVEDFHHIGRHESEGESGAECGESGNED